MQSLHTLCLMPAFWMHAGHSSRHPETGKDSLYSPVLGSHELEYMLGQVWVCSTNCVEQHSCAQLHCQQCCCLEDEDLSIMFSLDAHACVGDVSCKRTRWLCTYCSVAVVQQPAMQQILQHQPELAHKLLLMFASTNTERIWGTLPHLALHMHFFGQVIQVPSQPYACICQAQMTHHWFMHQSILA